MSKRRSGRKHETLSPPVQDSVRLVSAHRVVGLAIEEPVGVEAAVAVFGDPVDQVEVDQVWAACFAATVMERILLASLARI